MTLDSNITPTATEITNGGVVVLMAATWTALGQTPRLLIFYAEWVPIIAQEIVLSEPSLTLTEGSSGTYDVQLSIAPASGTVVVDVTNGTPAAATVAPAELTFTAADWNTAQSVTVTSVQNTDGWQNASVTLTHAIDQAKTVTAWDGVGNQTLTVTVEDDEAGLTVDPSTLTLTEGGTAGNYTVALNAAPASGLVTVRVASDEEDVTVAPDRLTYSTSNWNTAQTVTVTAASDADWFDETVTVSHTPTAAAGFTYAARSGENVTVTVRDPETTRPSTTSWRNTAAGYTQFPSVATSVLKATDTPQRVSLVGADASFNLNIWDYTSMLICTWTSVVPPVVGSSFAGNYPSGGSVSDISNDCKSASLSALSGGRRTALVTPTTDEITNGGVVVGYLNLRPAGDALNTQILFTQWVPIVAAREIVLSHDTTTALPVTEGATATYGVALNREPSGAVVVAVSSDVAASASAAPASLTFTAADWNTAQTVTVTGEQDGNQADETVTLTHAIVPADTVADFDDAADVTLEVAVTDDDAPGLLLSEQTLTLTEEHATEGSGTYTVVLTLAPTGPVTVAVQGAVGSVVVDTDGDAGNGADVNTLTFGTTDWNTAQTVAVRAGHDDDGQNDTVALTHAVTSSHTDYHELEGSMPARVPGVTVTVTDNDARGVTLDAYPATPAIVEAGPLPLTEADPTLGSTAYTVRLATRPVGGAVTVTIAATGGSTPQAVTVDPAPLEFTASTWNTARPVTATAPPDANLADESVTLTHTAEGADYTAALAVSATLEVTVTDDDDPQIVASPGAAVPVTEGGSTTYSVQLTPAPTGTVVVAVSSSDPTAASAAPASLTFTAADWNTAQTVTVTGEEDGNRVNETVTLTQAIVPADTVADFRNAADATVTVTVRDNDHDVPAGLTGATSWSGSNFGLVERPEVHTEFLTATTTSSQVVEIVQADPGSGSYYDFGGFDVLICLWTMVTPPSSTDGCRTATFRRFSNTRYGELGYGGPAPAGATNPGDPVGGGYADVTLTADEIAHGGVVIGLRGTQTGIVFTEWVPIVAPRIVPSRSEALPVTEGSSDTYDVQLTPAPTGTVVVAVSSSDPTAASAAPASLTFTAADWNTAQTVTVTGEEDGNRVNETVTLTQAIVPADTVADFRNAADATVTVTVRDNDHDVPAGLTGATSWSGSNFGLVERPEVHTEFLTATTTSSQVVEIVQADPGSGSYYDFGGFDVLICLWTMVTPPSSTDGCRTATFRRFSNTRYGELGYGGPAPAGATNPGDPVGGGYADVTLTADEIAHGGVVIGLRGTQTGIVFTEWVPIVAPRIVPSRSEALPVTEGSSDTYDVQLTPAPTGTVVVAVSSSDPTAASAAPASLTFTAADWNTAQTVTVTGEADDDAGNETVTLTQAIVPADTVADYDNAPDETVTVAVTDDDERGVWVAPADRTQTVAEDGEAEYPVTLGSAPTDRVVVLIGSDNPDVHARPGVLQFTAATWNTAQTVTVRADADADAEADDATVTHRASGGDYTGVADATVTVTVPDADAAVLFSRQSVTTLVGETNTYTVRLGTAPAGDVTVGVTSKEPGEATVVPGALTFGPTTWATAQPVTVTGVASGYPRVRHTVAGYGPGTAAEVEVWVLRPTDPLVVDPYFFELLEGEEGTYTVRLATQPVGGTVTVAAGQARSGFLTTGASFMRGARSLEFDASNWATAQPVTITSTARVNAAAGRDQFTHEVTGAVTASGTGLIAVQEVLDTVPLLGAVADRTVAVGQAVNVRLGAGVQTVAAGMGAGALAVAAATYANPPLRYELTGPGTATTLGLPAGLSFDPTTRRLYGTPQTAAPAATYTLTVTDAQGDTADAEFTLTVGGTPLLGFGERAGRYTRGERYVLPAPQAPAGTGLTFVVEPALPAGLRYVPPPETMAPYSTGGQIVGTPPGALPTRPYTLTVVDGVGNEAEVTFALAVAPPPPAPGPAPGPGPTDPGPTPGPSCGDAVVAAQEYRAGAAIAALVLPAATGGVGPLRYGVGPGLPAGLTYTAPADPTATGGVLTGVPVGAQAATAYTLTATEADGAETALLTFTIRVAGPGQIQAATGTRTYALGGRAVTVTQAAGTRAGVELTLPGRLAQDVAIRLRPPGPDVPLTRGRYGFGPAGAQAAVEMAVTPVPEGGLDVCVPVPAAVRAAARERAVQLVRYVGGRWARWARVAGATTEADRACGAGLTWFGPLAVGYANAVPTFGERTIPAQTGMVAAALTPVALPAATGGDGPTRYDLAPALPAGLTYILPTEAAAGMIAGVPTEARPATTYTLTATDVDGDAATLAFMLAVESEPVEVTVTDATAQEGMPVEFGVTLSRAVMQPVTVQWTAARPGSATPGEDYQAEAAGRLTLAAGTTTGTLRVRTLDDRRVEPPETFTVTVRLPEEAIFAATPATATGTIEDDDTEQARKRSVGMVLAGVGRTLATDAVDVIGDRFMQQPTTPQATVGGQALHLRRDGDTARWRHATGVAYGVARALGVEVGSPLEGGAGEFGQVRGAAWSALTRHLRDPHAATAPLSGWDTPGAFATSAGMGLGGPPPAPSIWGTPTLAGDASSIPPPSGRGLGGGFPAWGSDARPGLAGYGNGLGQRAFDRAHAATPQALQVGTFRAPVQFRRVSGTEVLAQSAFEMPLRRAANVADPGAPGEPAAQADAAAWTLWGRGTASGFDGKPKADFSMDGDVFTGYLGLDYRLQPNVLLGLAVAHSQGDVDYETTDVTKGEVDITLTSILPYAHWSPRPGLGVWGLFGAGWGDLRLRDEAGKVKTDLEMLMGAVGARQEVLTWRRIDVALKADAFLTELEAGADDRLPKTAGDAQRLRLMVEGRTAWAMSEDSHLTPLFEIGGRWDGGKAETGVGAEMGGGVEYAHTKLGLGIEARGRYLLAHQKSAFDEWGASLTLKLDPGEAKRGLWLALAPVWGAEASQVEQMWGSADVLQAGADSATPPGLSPAQVEFDIGYGLVTYEGTGLLTTYGGVSMAGPQSHGYRLGGRIELGEWIDLSVEGERTTQGGGAEHQVGLYGHLAW